MLAHAEVETENLIRENLNVVLALVDALVAEGKLTGLQVDAVIESAMDREYHLSFEVRRRADWQAVLRDAAHFAAAES
jgi:hypothetical protein